MVVSGWPISPINLTIEGDDGNQTQVLSDVQAVTFFDSLVVRPDKWQSLFYRRVFSIFALACSTCPVDHPTGNYSFEICSAINCFRTHNYIEHVGNNAAVLSRLEHPNIVRLYGMTRDGPRLLLVFERMNLGDLRSYLRARAPTSASYSQFPPALIESELKVIVRQISDFGMSRRLYGQADYYRMQNHCLLPVRWLPPEAINDHRFSTSSDVWYVQ
ncbi:unnamed protein product [Strongylus vulgaris]|uniref:Tyrosine-protein kinase catalytic domain-containing protein n=1 Tax=Strongylus vulgaris TaxID=40348 RepID=A0A3P7JGR7_STRVU|nr:unnamed protein product [Strongylus vulgaris]